MTVLFVALGAIFGAPARYLVDRAVRARHDTTFPWGTLTVNVTASLVLGLLVGAGSHVSAAVDTLVGVGFCGALSTYSTFAYENQQLVLQRSRFDVVAKREHQPDRRHRGGGAGLVDRAVAGLRLAVDGRPQRRTRVDEPLDAPPGPYREETQ